MVLRQFFIFCTLLLILHKGLSGQEDKKVVVTGIKYILVKNNARHVNTITFPFYFNDEIFFNTISNSLLNSLKSKFGVQKVTLMQGTTIQYGTGRPIRKVKPKVPSESNENDIYVGLATYLSADNFDSENDCYKLVTLATAVDYKGKIIYKSVNKIPFKVNYGDWILSDTVMNWRDFEYFYIQGLEACIKGEPKNFDVQYIDHQTDGEYDEFVRNSIKYEFVPAQNAYYLQNPDKERLTIINIREDPTTDNSIPASMEGLYKFQLENLAQKKNYDLRIYGFKEFIDETTFTINVIIGLKSDTEELYEFKLDPDYNLNGTIGKSQVLVYRNWDKSVDEFIIDNQLVAIMHEENNKRILYYYPDADPGNIWSIV